MAGSANIHPDNMFNSPDGIGFDEADGSGSRPMATIPTRSSLPAWATTRCCAPIPRVARCAAS